MGCGCGKKRVTQQQRVQSQVNRSNSPQSKLSAAQSFQSATSKKQPPSTVRRTV